jgi:uncharacterized protein YbbK (DUF523 family)
MSNVHQLAHQLTDHRSKKVVFLAHCILNENTRYLGGACRAGCVREIVEQCIDKGVGMVQLPCPEQDAWGGVTKRWLLMVYGSRGSLIYHLRTILLPLALWHTKRVYRRLAREAANHIGDYLKSGYTVIGIVGVDGSPSCGVRTTLDVRRAIERLARINVDSVTSAEVNMVIRACFTAGRGIFITALQAELRWRNIDVPFCAHDLRAEQDGQPSRFKLPARETCT